VDFFESALIIYVYIQVRTPIESFTDPLTIQPDPITSCIPNKKNWISSILLHLLPICIFW